MIVVRVELHSARTGKVTELARMKICNDGETPADEPEHEDRLRLEGPAVSQFRDPYAKPSEAVHRRRFRRAMAHVGLAPILINWHWNQGWPTGAVVVERTSEGDKIIYMHPAASPDTPRRSDGSWVYEWERMLSVDVRGRPWRWCAAAHFRRARSC